MRERSILEQTPVEEALNGEENALDKMTEINADKPLLNQPIAKKKRSKKVAKGKRRQRKRDVKAKSQ